MKYISELVAILTILFFWLAGIVLAKGIFSTTMTIIFPPYAWYLVVELIVKQLGY